MQGIQVFAPISTKVTLPGTGIREESSALAVGTIRADVRKRQHMQRKMWTDALYVDRIFYRPCLKISLGFFHDLADIQFGDGRFTLFKAVIGQAQMIYLLETCFFQ